MTTILEIIRQSKELFTLSGAKGEDILAAEEALNVKFSEEYKAYTAAFGAVRIHDIELTGVVPFADMNVVDVTVSARSITPQAEQDWYVIRDYHIEGLIDWQNEKGEVYQTCPCCETKKLCDSLSEYICR